MAPEAARTRLKETLKSIQTEILAECLHEAQNMRAKAQASALDRLATEAQLDASQKLELQRLFDREQEQVRAMMESGPTEGGGWWRSLRRDVRTLRGQTDAAAKALLRPEQVDEYETMRREVRREGRPGGFGPRGSGR